MTGIRNCKRAIVPADALQALHEAVGEIWQAERAHVFGGACGYSILGSRPALRPRLMVIGENPGFSAEDARGEAHIHTSWPDSSYLDGKTWPLKERLRDLFSRASSLDVLSGAVFTNFNFFKSSSQNRDSQYRWADVDAPVRKRVERACLSALRGLVQLVQPQQIMLLGFSAFDRHVENRAVVQMCRDARRRLIARGELWEVPTFALLHPSGARWSDCDKEVAAGWVKDHFAV